MAEIEPQQLQIYYQRYFPTSEFQNWLQHRFPHREFSFTLRGPKSDEEIYMRFKSFGNMLELQKELIERTPIKIDIGAIYNVKPKEKKRLDQHHFVPLERELVFDIDMTDYDKIRTCCQKTDICNICWGFMTCAIQVIDVQLRKDFGFKNIMWVFSGRRGVHCWVCDDRAMKLSKEERTAIVNYMSYKEDALYAKLLHPSLESALKSCSALFNNTLLTQMGILDNETEWSKVLAFVTDPSTRNELIRIFPTLENGKERWNVMKGKVKTGVLKHIIFSYTYPKLDAHVSTGLNHLLKTPFSIHPKTGRCCVPIDPQLCTEFDPFSVPTIQELIDNEKSIVPHVQLFKVMLVD